MTPPIRFLASVVVSWTVARLVVLWLEADSRAAPVPPASTGFARANVGSDRAREAGTRSEVAMPGTGDGSDTGASLPRQAATGLPTKARPSEAVWSVEPERHLASVKPGHLPVAQFPRRLANSVIAASGPVVPTRSGVPLAIAGDPLPVTRRVGRWSGDAWVLARGGDGTGSLASGTALLGGSQAGARLLYRVTDDVAAPVSLSARLSSPLRRRGAEAALGVEWQPITRLPVRVLAERRQRVSGDGRSAFALLAHGGISERPVGREFRLDGYAQAGMVGARSRDLFADGAVTLVRPLASGLAVGAGAWGGAQPGAARLDIGPRLTTTFAAAGGRARVSLDWRFRVAGDASPASGPSLTVGAGF